MNTPSASLTELELPLKTSFGTSRWKIRSRRIILLELFDPHSGYYGYGEAAPLEEFGTERYSQMLYALRQAVEENSFHRMLESPIHLLQGMTCSFSATPTARFAIESAVLDIKAKRERIPLRVLLGGEESLESIRVNAVIGDGTVGHAARTAHSAIDSGFGCIKIKVGAREIEEDRDRVAAVRQSSEKDMLIRLDANGAWTRKQAEHALHLLEPLSIEYLEQPLHSDDVDGLTGIADESPIPIAADESLQKPDDIRRFMESAVPVFILKPMAIGSIIETHTLAKALHSAGKKVVFTSFIDSSIGRSAAVQLAASLPFCKDVYHGFATGGMFVCDTTEHIAPVYGMLPLPSIPGIGVAPDPVRLHSVRISGNPA